MEKRKIYVNLNSYSSFDQDRCETTDLEDSLLEDDLYDTLRRKDGSRILSVDNLYDEDDVLLNQSSQNNECVSFKMNSYNIYSLLLLCISYLTAMVGRYMLSALVFQIYDDNSFGFGTCAHSNSYNSSYNDQNELYCMNYTTRNTCLQTMLNNSCEWYFAGGGVRYQILVGPVYIIAYSFVGIILALIADYTRRSYMLGLCTLILSVALFVTGNTSSYTVLAVFRFIQAVGEAGFIPFSTSLIGDYFTPYYHATAVGIYNWGSTIGFSLAIILSDRITALNILDQGWRWCYYIMSIFALILAITIILSLKEPARRIMRIDDISVVAPLYEGRNLTSKRMKLAFKKLSAKPLIMLCIAASIRHSASEIWRYNALGIFQLNGQSLFDASMPLFWIAIIGGLVGQLLGGIVSDRALFNHDISYRFLVVVISTILAGLCGVGVLYCDTPLSYYWLLASDIFGYAWNIITIVAVMELMPVAIRTTAIAIFIFFIMNIAGLSILLQPLLQEAFETMTSLKNVDSFKASMYVLYPGCYFLSALLFYIVMIDMKKFIADLNFDMEETETASVSIFQLHHIIIFRSVGIEKLKNWYKNRGVNYENRLHIDDSQ